MLQKKPFRILAFTGLFALSIMLSCIPLDFLKIPTREPPVPAEGSDVTEPKKNFPISLSDAGQFLYFVPVIKP